MAHVLEICCFHSATKSILSMHTLYESYIHIVLSLEHIMQFYLISGIYFIDYCHHAVIIFIIQIHSGISKVLQSYIDSLYNL